MATDDYYKYDNDDDDDDVKDVTLALLELCVILAERPC
jgi:hypothetical protein